MLAIYPGSFDPITLGHLDIIERGCKLFDQVIVAVLRNPNKTPLFTVPERIEQIRLSTPHLSNLEVDSFDGLTIDYAKMRHASALLRGLRVLSDFEMELQMAHTNKTLSAQIETVFLATSNEYSFLSSSLVKEIARFGGAIDHLVPKHVAVDIYQCFAKIPPASAQTTNLTPPPDLPKNGIAHRESARSGNVDIQRELNRLEEIILDSPRVPMTRWTWVDEEQLLEQLDLVRLSLPEAFHEADAIARQKEELFLQAEQYAQEVVENAERRAAQILNEMGILRQAEIEAQKMRQQVQQECEAAEAQTIAEIERMRRQAQQELEEMQRLAIAECEEIQAGADEYADRVLQEMERQLSEMMRVVRNGRQQLQPEAPPTRSRETASGSQSSRSPSTKSDRAKS